MIPRSRSERLLNQQRMACLLYVCPSAANTGSCKMALVNGQTKVLKSKSRSPHDVLLSSVVSELRFAMLRARERVDLENFFDSSRRCLQRSEISSRGFWKGKEKTKKEGNKGGA